MFKIKNYIPQNTTDYINYSKLTDYTRHMALEIGDFKLSARSTDVNGWLVCNGRSLLISEYEELYAVIGTSFGSTGAGYFSLPDYSSRVIGMYGPSATSSTLTVRNRGDKVGTETHTLSVSEMPTHSHTGTTDSNGSHNHSVSSIPYGVQSITAAGGSGIEACDETTTTYNTTTAGAHTHTFTSNNNGGSQAHNNMQPTLFGCNVLIYSKHLRNMTPMVYV